MSHSRGSNTSCPFPLWASQVGNRSIPGRRHYSRTVSDTSIALHGRDAELCKHNPLNRIPNSNSSGSPRYSRPFTQGSVGKRRNRVRKRLKQPVNQLWLKYLFQVLQTHGHVNKLQEPGWAFASEEYWSLISISITATPPLLMNCSMWLTQRASLSSPAFSLTGRPLHSQDLTALSSRLPARAWTPSPASSLLSLSPIFLLPMFYSMFCLY